MMYVVHLMEKKADGTFIDRDDLGKQIEGYDKPHRLPSHAALVADKVEKQFCPAEFVPDASGLFVYVEEV